MNQSDYQSHVKALRAGEAAQSAIEDQFDNLYEVILSSCGSKKTLRLRYGTPTP